jgi:ABC-type glycerol-3-phosphate transport system permease component
VNYKFKRKLDHVSLYACIIVFGLLFLVPLLWMIIASVKPETDIFKDMGLRGFLIEHVTLSNYIEVFQRIPFMQYLSNSLITVGGVVFLGLIVNSLCAYALVNLKFPGTNLILMIIIALYIIPFESVLLPLYIIINKFGWMNHYAALIFPFVADSFNIFLFRQFFMKIPIELEESAHIDGATPLQTFIRIILPNCKPVFVTSGILTFVNHWNSFMWPLIVTTEDRYRTIQVGIQFFFTDPPILYGNIMAALTLSTLPVIVLFMFFQRYYVEGITSSGIKA